MREMDLIVDHIKFMRSSLRQIQLELDTQMALLERLELGTSAMCNEYQMLTNALREDPFVRHDPWHRRPEVIVGEDNPNQNVSAQDAPSESD